MAFADTSTYTLAYAEESTFDQAPTGSGIYKLLRNTGESLNTSLESAKSGEIDSGRQYTGSVHVSGSSSGSVNFELSYGEYDPFIEAALQGTWTGTIAAGTVSSIASNVVTIPSTSALEVGAVVKLSGLTNSADDGIYTVLKVLSGTTFQTVETLTDQAAAGGTIDFDGLLKNGSTFRSFAFEKNFKVGANDNYFLLSGMVPSTLSMSLSTGSILSGEIGFMGATGVASNTSKDSGTYLPSLTNELMNSVSNVSGLNLSTVALDGTQTLLSNVVFQELSVSIDNSLREQKGVGNLFASGIGSGRINVETSATIYFADRAVYDTFVANDSVQLRFQMQDDAGNTYGVVFPEMKVASHEVSASGPDADIMASISLSAVKDTRSGTGSSVIFSKVNAV